MDFYMLSTLLTFILAVSDDAADALVAAPMLLWLSGFIFYFLMYAHYRNKNKRHSHESETTSTVANLVVADTLIQHKKGLRNKKMKGSNHIRTEGALNQQVDVGELLKKAFK